MTAVDPSAFLARASLWSAELRARGQMDDATETRLNETLAESLGERLDRQDDPLLVVMLCGPTAVGKSSLINALAGAEISPPGLGATTRSAVLYVHEKDDPARLFEYSAALGGSEQQETELVRHNRDELLHKILVDTPDIDSVRLQHREVTARLVHAADLVLFVTSPEKYKVMRSARWILEQRQQRGMAFVLNKWDREALGLQSDRREELAQDFRDVLTGEGFPDALIFKVSALAMPSGDGIENELPALRAWLETGISQSTAATIRRRRLRAAWGRLAAAIEHAAPRALSGHPVLPRIFEGLAGAGGAAAQTAGAEASILEPVGLEDSGWPATPGLLGMWTRTWQRVASTAASLRTGLAMLNVAARTGNGGSRNQPGAGNTFGARSAAMLSVAMEQAISEARAAHLALGPVGAAWMAETVRLERQLSLLPLDIAADLTAQANRPSLRRFAGIAFVYAVEILIVLVLLTTVARVGADFIAGTYASGGLFVTSTLLILSLVIIGHTAAAMCFPPLRQRMRRAVAQRAIALVKAAVEKTRDALREHVEAVDRLAREGRELLLQIDRAVIALATETGNGASVDRLFGEPPPQLRLTAEPLADPIQARSSTEVMPRRPASFD
jgi:energy-coupling factor transporter ATP-binding protein EcfA2